VLNSESIVIIRIKGEHLLYSKISGGMIGYGWGNVCYIVNFTPGEYLLYSKVSGGKVYYIANIPMGNVYYIVNIPGEGLLCGRFTIRHRNYFLGNLCEQYGGSRREEELEDTKGVIIIRKSKDTQHNGQEKTKRTNNDLHNIHIKLKIE